MVKNGTKSWPKNVSMISCVLPFILCLLKAYSEKQSLIMYPYCKCTAILDIGIQTSMPNPEVGDHHAWFTAPLQMV